MKKPSFSFLICTKNCETTIQKVLESIKQQSHYSLIHEVLIVFHNTTDNTLKIASEFTKRHNFPLKMIECKEAGKTPALLLGLEKISGNYCVIVDDDNFLYPDYISNSVDLIKDENIACFGARGHIDQRLKQPVWFPEYRGHFAIGLPKGKTDWVWGACALINMKAWKKLSDLNYKIWINIERKDNVKPIEIGGEDSEFSLAFGLVGFKVKFTEKLNFVHSFSQKRLQKDYFLSNTLGCFKAAPIIELYRIVINNKYPHYPIIGLYYILLRNIVSNILRAFIAFFLKNNLKAKYHLTIVLGVFAGFKLFRKDFGKIYSELYRIKKNNA